MYLSKYRHENCSPNLVPVAKNPGFGSPPRMLWQRSFKRMSQVSVSLYKITRLNNGIHILALTLPIFDILSL